MKKSFAWFVLLGMAVAVQGGWVKQAQAAKPLPAQVEAGVVEVDATVKSIDYGDREVTLQDKDGNTVTVNVDKSVKNFRKIKKGDIVTARFFESIAWVVEKPGTEPLSKSESTTQLTAKPGQKPAMAEAEQIDIVAKIVKLNKGKKAPSVTLQGPDGNQVTVKVQDRDNLKGVKVGDEVHITYTEAVAVAFEKKE